MRTVVATGHGRIEGAISAGVAAFKGVPFAAPPVGSLRWRMPAPPDAWTGVRPATAFGPDCPQAPQPRLRGAGMTEDCLHLNVWTPAPDPDAALPVMVWVPGGGFVGGSGSDRRADGARLASLGVVVVTLNYRVGLYGYLAHPDLNRENADGVSGNYGLADVAAAFAWVRDHIRAFGGDPGRVTAFGVSAGSASISLLMTSPGFDGLFDRAILESPGAFRPLTPLADAAAAGFALGPDIGALRDLSGDALFKLTGRMTPARRALTGPRTLRPIRDGRMLVEDDRDAWKRGATAAMPIIVGVNADEGSLFTDSWKLEGQADFTDFLKDAFGDMAAEAATVYPAASADDIQARLAEMFGDTQFVYGAWGIADAMAAKGEPVWRYLLSRRPGGRTRPIRHGEDVAYVFGNLEWAETDGGELDAADWAASDAMMRAWVRFAHGAAPMDDWPSHRPGDQRHMEFGDRIGAGEAWRRDAAAFIERYYASRGALASAGP